MVVALAAVRVGVDALDEQRRDLKLAQLLPLNWVGLLVGVKAGERAVGHPEGQVGAEVGHEVAPDERLLGHGVEGQAGALDGAKGQVHVAAVRHCDLLFGKGAPDEAPVHAHILHRLDEDAGDPAPHTLQAGHVAVVGEHEPLEDAGAVQVAGCGGLRLSLRHPQGAEQQLDAAELVGGKEAGAF